MPRQIGKLPALAIPRIKAPGLHSDGGGLYIRVTQTGGRFWVFRFMLNGKAREMGLGALHTVTLSDARKKATACRDRLSEGIDPIDARNVTKAQQRLEAARAQTFKQCAEAYIDSHKAGWRNAKHLSQWTTTLATYVYPIFGHIAVQDVDLTLVMKVFEQKNSAFSNGQTLWLARPETASRLRGRIEVILDWATVREYRQGENPARWRGHLQNLLPHHSKLQQVTHQPALPYDQVASFITALKHQTGTAALALEFTILTASRTSETIGATWDEIDLNGKTWTIPANRIKGGREHRVPLSQPAMKILHQLKTIRDLKKPVGIAWVFPGQKPGKPLSNMAMLVLLKRMKRQDITVHGFRSTFRDWAAEQTRFPREVAEACLAHVNADKVEEAYRRSDLFDKRRQLIDAWAKYCMTAKPIPQAGNVIAIAGVG